MMTFWPWRCLFKFLGQNLRLRTASSRVWTLTLGQHPARPTWRKGKVAHSAADRKHGEHPCSHGTIAVLRLRCHWAAKFRSAADSPQVCYGQKLEVAASQNKTAAAHGPAPKLPYMRSRTIVAPENCKNTAL